MKKFNYLMGIASYIFISIQGGPNTPAQAIIVSPPETKIDIKTPQVDHLSQHQLTKLLELKKKMNQANNDNVIHWNGTKTLREYIEQEDPKALKALLAINDSNNPLAIAGKKRQSAKKLTAIFGLNTVCLALLSCNQIWHIFFEEKEQEVITKSDARSVVIPPLMALGNGCGFLHYLSKSISWSSIHAVLKEKKNAIENQ